MYQVALENGGSGHLRLDFSSKCPQSCAHQHLGSNNRSRRGVSVPERMGSAGQLQQITYLSSPLSKFNELCIWNTDIYRTDTAYLA